MTLGPGQQRQQAHTHIHMAEGADLEAQNKWDGSWYDLDIQQSHPEVSHESVCGLKTVYK